MKATVTASRSKLLSKGITPRKKVQSPIKKATSSSSPKRRRKHLSFFFPYTEEYVARKSRRFIQCKPHDGDVWVEFMVLLDKEKKIRRSFFQSQNTHKCTWDEPPSGASELVFQPHRYPRFIKVKSKRATESVLKKKKRRVIVGLKKSLNKMWKEGEKHVV